MQQRTYIELDFHQLERLVAATFGPGWEAVAAGEWQNDNSYRFLGINGDLDSRDRADLDRISQQQCTAFHPSPRQVLKALVRRGVLKAGNYLITVS